MIANKCALFVVLIMSILTFLTGCISNGRQPAPETEQALEAAPIPFPEGAELTGFYMTRQGMAAAPYYILKTTDMGTYMKISDSNPEACQMDSGTDISELGANWQYLGFGDTVLDCENASLVLLEDKAPVRELENAIVQSGALGWDGYEEHRSMKGVSDSGDTYALFLAFSDGTTVKVHGYNACPDGFDELLGQIMDIFYENINDE